MAEALSTHEPVTTWVNHIPVIWIEPVVRRPDARLVIWLSGLTGVKEQNLPYLQDLAAAGFVALSFDAWQHGARGTETPQQIAERVFGNFRHEMWPIIGQTTLDTLRVIDWAVVRLGVNPQVYMGGMSMGGDISVAAAGLDHRIQRVAAVIATPDWLRPGMQDLSRPGELLPPGEPDAYARYFYDLLNPLTHLDSYAHAPAIDFECAAEDTHVLPDGALRFQAALRQKYPAAAERIRVNLIPGRSHKDGGEPIFWQNSLEWLTRSEE